MTRKRIGFNFTWSTASNSGIVNYVFSMVNALRFLEDDKKPHVAIFYEPESPIELIQKINYPYISFYLMPKQELPLSLPLRLANKISHLLTGKRPFHYRITTQHAEGIYPYFYWQYDWQFRDVPKKIFWLVDFNAHYLPHLFKEEDIKSYIAQETSVTSSENEVVVSSYTVLEDLKKFYPNYKNKKVHVLRFAAVLPDFSEAKIEEVKAKYGIEGPYFITPNQFWPHKNHMTLLKAVKQLNDLGFKFQMIFTGNTKTDRGVYNNYFEGLQQYVAENQLDNVKFLGIVDRKDQLQLMSNAFCIVQPSLFEGWSTLVEESKALNKYIVLSDLPIHREQIKDNCSFFEPENEKVLADILSEKLQNGVEVKKLDYEENIRQFAEDILQVFS